MWPFDHKHEDNLLPQVPAQMHQPVDYSPEARIRALEQHCAMLERAIRELCQAVVIGQEASNHNFATMQQSFLKLVQYVMTPRKSIMGENRDTN